MKYRHWILMRGSAALTVLLCISGAKGSETCSPAKSPFMNDIVEFQICKNGRAQLWTKMPVREKYDPDSSICKSKTWGDHILEGVFRTGEYQPAAVGEVCYVKYINAYNYCKALGGRIPSPRDFFFLFYGFEPKPERVSGHCHAVKRLDSLGHEEFDFCAPNEFVESRYSNYFSSEDKLWSTPFGSFHNLPQWVHSFVTGKEKYLSYARVHALDWSSRTKIELPYPYDLRAVRCVLE